MRCRTLLGLHSAFCILHCAAPAAAQVGAPITEIAIEQEGRRVNDPVLNALIQTRVGDPLDMKDVRETEGHFTSLNRFEGVEVVSERSGAGIRLRYLLTPLHPVDRIEFLGTLGLPEDALRRLVVDRFGASPRAGRGPEISESLRAEYRRRGYVGARIVPRVVPTHNPDRATLFFDIASGRQLTIAEVKVTEVDAGGLGATVERPDVKPGQPFDEDAIERELRAWEDRLRAREYYEARASHGSQVTDDGAVVTLRLRRGPRVVLRFAGDPLPETERERLVPIRAEGSADQDLLEDSSRAIEAYLHDLGYRDGSVSNTSNEREGDLVITFHVTRGPRYLVRGVSLAGHTALTEQELLPLVTLAPGEPFVRSTLATGRSAIQRLYRSRGFTRVEVTSSEVVQVPGRPSDSDRPTDVRIGIVEGPRTMVRSVTFAGHAALDEATLRGVAMVASGQAFSEAAIAADRERIDLEYRNRGYDGIVVTPDVTLGDGGTQADVVFRMTEGPQAMVDHIIIVGNRRTSTETITRELLLREGQPLGYSALQDSRARLAALGLFRRVEIQALAHGSEARRDVLVQVEEALPTVLDWGGGVEGGFVLRTGVGGVAEERFEFAPRGFFQIGRRNLWGKNRSVDLFTRVTLRSRDRAPAGTVPLPQDEPLSSYGFHEYRVVGQFREPRALDTSAEVLVTGIIEQAIRSSFNFSRREVRAQAELRLSPKYSLAGLYSFQRIRLFDEHFTPEEKPLIDRLFPEVRISKLSGSVIRDSRDDALDASSGTLATVDGDLAARALGSEVGFVSTYLQGFYYRRLPVPRRLVLALGARLGVAYGFPREVDGRVVQDLPASERFFAGGDTSVRGFTLDRLGNERTTTASGFPTGGNSVVVLNSELRVSVTGALQAVGFLDAGNVFPRASDLDLSDLRPAAGFGVMYDVPLLGPVRVDVGFNLDRRMLVPGTLERRSVLHILLVPAF